MKIILITLFCTIFYFYASAQEVYTYDNLNNPDNFFVVDDSLLIVYDNSSKDEALCLINIYNFDVINCIRGGRGPGEFSGQAVHILIDRTDELIYAWDYGLQRVTKFNYQLNYIEDLPISERFRGALAILPFDDSHQLYLRMNEDSFGEIVEINKDSIITYIDNDHDPLAPIGDNFLLKQGTYSLDGKYNFIIFTSKYSSIILKVSPSGLEFVSLGKPGIPFPEREKDGEYGIPSLHKYTTSTIDASVFNEKLYTLHSGKSTTYRKAFWYILRGIILELAEELETGNKLLVYNLNNGMFINEINLPYDARKAKIFKDKVFVLHDTKDGFVISVVPLANL